MNLSQQLKLVSKVVFEWISVFWCLWGGVFMYDGIFCCLQMFTFNEVSINVVVCFWILFMFLSLCWEENVKEVMKLEAFVVGLLLKNLK